MAYRYGNRDQITFLPPSIEDYVAPEDPVRAYDVFVDTLDLEAIGIELDPHKLGTASYDPKAMLKLLVYGYSYGVKSSRKLEREVYHNLSFIWLMGGLKPDHKTIAEFRRKNKEALSQVLKQCVRLCIEMDLISGNVLFVDGTKIRANAARSRSHDRAYYKKRLVEIDKRIKELLAECDRIDQHEEGLGSSVAMKKELAKAGRLKASVEQTLGLFEEGGPKKINQTDPDSAVMKSRQGSHASHNVQSVADDKHGLLVHAEAVSDTSDVNQFARQIDQANAVLDKDCEVGCADAGYADTEELEKIAEQGIKVIVPSQSQALHNPKRPFHKSHFTYDKEQDCYSCPEGHQLRYMGTDSSCDKRHYQIHDRKVCHQCPNFGKKKCTSAKRGRKIIRGPLEELKEKFEALYEEKESQEIYARRKARIEHPFGHIKRNLKTDAFMLRGREGVGAETSLLATCFNLSRMSSILGISGLIKKLKAISAQTVGAGPQMGALCQA